MPDLFARRGWLRICLLRDV